MFFKKPTIRKVIQNQLDEARRAQLEHAKLAEWAQGMVQVHEARIKRLRFELQMETKTDADLDVVMQAISKDVAKGLKDGPLGGFAADGFTKSRGPE